MPTANTCTASPKRRLAAPALAISAADIVQLSPTGSGLKAFCQPGAGSPVGGGSSPVGWLSVVAVLVEGELSVVVGVAEPASPQATSVARHGASRSIRMRAA